MKAQWIWENASPAPDEYAEFTAEFAAGGKNVLRISADSQYAVYLNGELAVFGQYGDFPHYKVFDEVDITPFCREGKNTLSVIVWYFGTASSVYFPGKAGVCFEVLTDGETAVCSGADTLCRADVHYVPHQCKIITSQMGYSFHYDASADESVPFHPAVLTGFEADPVPRPNKKLVLEESIVGKMIGGDGLTHFLLDLGREEVGFISLKLVSDTKQKITVAYGEHIVDGCVRRKVGGRDFSVEYTVKPGENAYMNPFRRLGCRYLEIFCEEPIALHEAAVVPTVYPVTEVPFDAGTPLRQAIYDVCVRTLRLCMHEHYEDCPWREQALYAMDGRNQIIAGYHAFREYQFPRSCLSLMAQDRRPDGLLAITTPCGTDLTIPSFSLHYFIEVLEYTQYTGDESLAREVWDKLCSVLAVFTSRIENDLIPTFPGKQNWNFYEWSSGLSGRLGRHEDACPDLLLNCLAVRAIDAMRFLAAKLDLPFDAGDTADRIRAAIRRTFWLPEEGLFSDYNESVHISELGNSLAILAGVITGEEAAALAKKLAERKSDAVAITLSMKCFLYDALLQVDRDTYAPWILADIEAVYKPMLDAGATSVWETEKGEADFNRAGSLCHGWSAMPVYYYHVLLEK
ncbi:MAG: hypothetical protein E7662_03575 [Ruminococcaceae bacterium]|nr:hypothetical protein [Oscillospiraceae bacterium]